MLCVVIHKGGGKGGGWRGQGRETDRRRKTETERKRGRWKQVEASQKNKTWTSIHFKQICAPLLWCCRQILIGKRLLTAVHQLHRWNTIIFYYSLKRKFSCLPLTNNKKYISKYCTLSLTRNREVKKWTTPPPSLPHIHHHHPTKTTSTSTWGMKYIHRWIQKRWRRKTENTYRVYQQCSFWRLHATPVVTEVNAQRVGFALFHARWGLHNLIAWTCEVSITV